MSTTDQPVIQLSQNDINKCQNFTDLFFNDVDKHNMQQKYGYKSRTDKIADTLQGYFGERAIGNYFGYETKFKPFNKKKNLEDILSNKVTYVNTFNLKNRLITDGYKDRVCEKCGLSNWLNNPIPLELHHVNGNRLDNSLINLQILCSNCHGQTDNYCSKNTKRYINNKNTPIIEIIGRTDKQIIKSFNQRKVERPSLDVLINDTKEIGFSATGRKYGVSDNAIRKWIKQYKKDIKY